MLPGAGKIRCDQVSELVAGGKKKKKESENKTHWWVFILLFLCCFSVLLNSRMAREGKQSCVWGNLSSRVLWGCFLLFRQKSNYICFWGILWASHYICEALSSHIYILKLDLKLLFTQTKIKSNSFFFFCSKVRCYSSQGVFIVWKQPNFFSLL